MRFRQPRGYPDNPIGQRFGSLTVIDRAIDVNKKRDHAYWIIRCDCGKSMEKRWSSIRDGKRCGSCTPIVHGCARRGAKSSEYMIWATMKARCLNPNSDDFQYYGGRGITICERWVDSFQSFFDDMGPRPSPDHSIDRQDNDGNYEPGNCRWVTRPEQYQNKRPWGGAK